MDTPLNIIVLVNFGNKLHWSLTSEFKSQEVPGAGGMSHVSPPSITVKSRPEPHGRLRTVSLYVGSFLFTGIMSAD